MWPKKRTQNMSEQWIQDLLVVPDEGGNAGSCMVLMSCFLWLPSSTVPRTVPAQTRAANRLCMNVFGVGLLPSSLPPC